MHHISEMTCGKYYPVRHVEKMGSDLSELIKKEQSVVAMNIGIPFYTHDGVTISSINFGGPKNNDIGEEAVYGVADINRLYAGVDIKFTVYLRVPKGRKQKVLEKLMTGGTTDMKLLTVGGGAHVERPVSVSVKRTAAYLKPVVSQLVDDELKRMDLVRHMSDLAKNKPGAAGLETIRNELLESNCRHLASKWKLEEDIMEMQKGISDANTHKIQGLPYMLSWLSHNWQCATAKGLPFIPHHFLPTSTSEQHTKLYIPPRHFLPSTLEQHTMGRAALLQLLPCALSSLVILLLAVFFGLCTGVLKPLWPVLQLMMESSTMVTVMNRAIQQYLYSVSLIL